MIGNVIGSNISNLLLVIGATAVVHPIDITRGEIIYDIPLTIGFSIAMVAMLLRPLGINRRRGTLLLGAYLLSMVVIAIAKTV